MSEVLRQFVLGKTQYSALDHKYRVKVTEGRETAAIFWHTKREKAEERATRFIATELGS